MGQVPDFIPAPWLIGGHAQTIWPNFPYYNKKIDEDWERLELPDGDFLDIVWVKNSQGPIVIILHGLGGSLESPYAHKAMAALANRGFRPVLMHYRGTSGVPNRLDISYHSGYDADVAYLTEVLKKRYPSTPIYGVGFSIGANILLGWLGKTGEKNPLDKIVVVSCPFDLKVCVEHISKGIGRLYQWWLLKGVKDHFKLKYKNRPCPFDYKEVMKCKNFFEFDDLVTAPLYGYKDVYDYYDKVSSRRYLSGIRKPTLIIHAKDDPFTAPSVIPSTKELSPSTELMLTETGGHVGFFAKGSKFWLNEAIPEYLR